jgi:hypothetical protein
MMEICSFKVVRKGENSADEEAGKRERESERTRR